jgi:ribosomal protein S18 acetylase RimI-like enzyme
LTYRIMRAEDYDGAFALWQSTPGMGLNSLDDSREGIVRYLERNPQTCFVAEEADRICGTVLSGHDGRRGYFYHTAVAREKQGQGVGSRLVELAVEALKAQGITKVALVAFSENENGNAFWEHQGFTLREDLSYRNLRLKPL